MCSPGANRSTLVAPKFENDERMSSGSVAPTQITFGASYSHGYTDVLPSLSQLRAAAAPNNTLPYEIYGNITIDRSFQNTLPFTANGAVALAASER